jgi:hypothetical protein
MLKRAEPLFRIICLVLGGLLLFQMLSLAVHKDPLAGVRVPAALTAPPKPGAEKSLPPRTNVNLNAVAKPPGPRGKGPELPPAVQARIDRITQSEILGPVMRPPPMALIGIAGADVFLRGPSGQTGLLREGEELGGVKLLKIGTNRVLVEHEGQKKELTLFSGFGSETLLPSGKEHEK